MYDRSNKEDLRVYLYNSCVHDSEIEKTELSPDGISARIVLYNTWLDKRLEIICDRVERFLFVNGNWSGSRNTVNYLGLEGDYTRLEPHDKSVDRLSRDLVYLLFQTFCGSELHIVSEAVSVREI